MALASPPRIAVVFEPPVHPTHEALARLVGDAVAVAKDVESMCAFGAEQAIHFVHLHVQHHLMGLREREPVVQREAVEQGTGRDQRHDLVQVRDDSTAGENVLAKLRQINIPMVARPIQRQRVLAKGSPAAAWRDATNTVVARGQPDAAVAAEGMARHAQAVGVHLRPRGQDRAGNLAVVNVLAHCRPLRMFAVERRLSNDPSGGVRVAQQKCSGEIVT